MISAQLYYRLAFEPLAIDSPLSRFTVDITETLERKIASIRCYQTQFPPQKEYVFDRVESMARTTGAEAGVGAGELFFTTRPLVSQDLVTTVLGG